MIVADTNVIAYLVLPSEFTVEALAAWERDPMWCVPVLWRSELANFLARQIRLRHLKLELAQEIMNTAIRKFKENEYSVSHLEVLSLAASSGKTAYDCEFVALAKTLGVVLVTNDGPLLKAFPKVAISLHDFIQP